MKYLRLVAYLIVVHMCLSSAAHAEEHVSVVAASWYESGTTMANNEPFDPDNPTVVAHRSLPFGTLLHLTNLENGRSLTVCVQDRGPYARDRHGKYLRDLDLSRKGAVLLNFIEDGHTKVRMNIVRIPKRPHVCA